MRAGGFELGVIALCACGSSAMVTGDGDGDVSDSDGGGVIEPRDVCGVTGPYRLFQLATQPTDSFVFHEPKRVGDRLLWWRTRWWNTGELPDERQPAWMRDNTWTTGLCGESPMLIPTADHVAFVDPALPNLIIGSIKEEWPGYSLIVMDPSDPRTSVLFAAEHRDFRTATSHGWLLHHDDVETAVSTLSLYPYPSDPWAGPIEPLPVLDAGGDAALQIESLGVQDETVFATTAELELVRIDLLDGTIRPELSGVRNFELSDDARWLMWRNEVDEVWLRDRWHEIDQPIGTGELFWHDKKLANGIVFDDSRPLQLPDLEPAKLPTDMVLYRQIADGSWIAYRPAEPGIYGADCPPQLFCRPETTAISLVDVATGEERPLYGEGVAIMELRDDGIEVAPGLDPFDAPSSDGHLDQELPPQEAPLTFVPFDGSPPQLLAARVTASYVRLADGRIVTPVDIASDGTATLVLVDPDSLDEVLIEDGIDLAWWSVETGWSRSLGFREADPSWWGDSVLIYSIASGERQGVWLLRLPSA